MSKTFSTKKIIEGNTEIVIPKQKQSEKGPGSKEGIPFYNPAMELNRDLSILVTRWLIKNSKHQIKILDGLAASGIRGIRLASELSGDFEITINDWDEQAFNLINKNIKNLELKDVTTTNKDLNQLLSEQRFHYIDIDPFGSPVSFVDAAIRSIINNGIIAATATDTATLCGVYPKVCLRRYGVSSYHSYVMKETGLRILLGFLCREAAKYDKGIQPLICHISDHYIRVYIKIKKGLSFANKSVSMLQNIDSDKLTLSLSKTKKVVGPLWMGKLHDLRFIQDIRTALFEKNLKTKHKLWQQIALIEEEADAPAFFYTTDDIASKLRVSPPKIKDIFDALKSKGFIVTKTQFSPTGFKTNASINEIEAIFQ